MTALPELFDLTGRPAVVTGARRGIGLAIAEALAAAGADIVAVSANLEPSGSEVHQRVTALGRRCTPLRADFAERTAVVELADVLQCLDRPVDMLVNNAGTIARAPTVDHTDQDRNHVLTVNPTSQFTLTREVGRQMLDCGRGRVIFTASLLSLQGGIDVPGYTAAKSGIAGLTRGPGQRVGRARRERQRARARVRGHRQHSGPQGGRPALHSDPRPHLGRTLGAARGSRGRGGVPGLSRLGLRARRAASRRWGWLGR